MNINPSLPFICLAISRYPAALGTSTYLIYPWVWPEKLSKKSTVPNRSHRLLIQVTLIPPLLVSTTPFSQISLAVLQQIGSNYVNIGLEIFWHLQCQDSTRSSYGQIFSASSFSSSSSALPTKCALIRFISACTSSNCPTSMHPSTGTSHLSRKYAKKVLT